MSKGAAREEVLGELHSKVAQVMKNALDRADKMATPSEDEDAIVVEVNPALLTAVTNFLKQNQITVDTSSEVEELSATERRLREKREKRGNVVSLMDLPTSETG